MPEVVNGMALCPCLWRWQQPGCRPGSAPRHRPCRISYRAVHPRFHPDSSSPPVHAADDAPTGACAALSGSRMQAQFPARAAAQNRRLLYRTPLSDRTTGGGGKEPSTPRITRSNSPCGKEELLKTCHIFRSSPGQLLLRIKFQLLGVLYSPVPNDSDRPTS